MTNSELTQSITSTAFQDCQEAISEDEGWGPGSDSEQSISESEPGHEDSTDDTSISSSSEEGSDSSSSGSDSPDPHTTPQVLGPDLEDWTSSSSSGSDSDCDTAKAQSMPISKSRPLHPLAQPSTLKSRLTSFLPALKKANDTLEHEREAGTLEQRNIENVEDEEEKGYIEMDLGLGVLEEKGAKSEDGYDTTSSLDDDDLGAESEAEDLDLQGVRLRRKNIEESQNRAALDRLMGRSTVGSKPAIEIL